MEVKYLQNENTAQSIGGGCLERNRNQGLGKNGAADWWFISHSKKSLTSESVGMLFTLIKQTLIWKDKKKIVIKRSLRSNYNF